MKGKPLYVGLAEKRDVRAERLRVSKRIFRHFGTDRFEFSPVEVSATPLAKWARAWEEKEKVAKEA